MELNKGQKTKHYFLIFNKESAKLVRFDVVENEKSAIEMVKLIDEHNATVSPLAYSIVTSDLIKEIIDLKSMTKSEIHSELRGMLRDMEAIASRIETFCEENND